MKEVTEEKIKSLIKRLQKKADEFWQMDQENWVLWHWNTYEVWIASGIEEAIRHIETHLLDNK